MSVSSGPKYKGAGIASVREYREIPVIVEPHLFRRIGLDIPGEEVGPPQRAIYVSASFLFQGCF